MLTELRIENFAIIHQMELSFQPGLSTFTGETGAGKSILLDALDALVGGRVDASMIRSGSERALVEASFRLPPSNRQAIHSILRREELLDDPDNITLGRELRREGRSIARVNGRTVNLILLRELGSFLVDIHGQSEHLSLLNVRQHLRLLDRFSDSETTLGIYRRAYQRLTAVRHELKALRAAEQDAARRTDMLNYQAQEIEAARLLPGEEVGLRQERDRLANAENLAQLAQQSLSILDEGNPEEPSVSDLVGRVVESLAALSRIDSSQANLYQQAAALADSLAEISRDLRAYSEQIEFNPRRLEQTEERLNLINNLKRKYGGSVETALAFAADARRQLETIASAGERIAELAAEETLLLDELARQGGELSAQRHSAAERMGRAVEVELADLSMAGARFSVDLHCEPDPEGIPLPDGTRVAFDESGYDRGEFLIAPNPGEGLKPLVKIASGGETSRLMLALKNVLARADEVPTLIFDEIDQGIGGRVGAVVGEKLYQLARRHQVLCVTHLPQLAAFGEQHFHVRKVVVDGRTQTQVELLNETAQLDELAQMLGSLNEANRLAARDTLTRARQRVEEIRAGAPE
ncbi:MAG: DNA repair protein RecN [Anaerolineaceae bacterium]|nr:DNA repair protein RecN [Anaerolineaceae bacterium]